MGTSYEKENKSRRSYERKRGPFEERRRGLKKYYTRGRSRCQAK